MSDDAAPERRAPRAAVQGRRHRRLLWLLVALAGTAFVVVLAWPAESWPLGSSPPGSATHEAGGGGWFAAFGDWLGSIPPWTFVLSFVVLPAFGAPLSVHYLIVGAVFRGLPLSLSVALACMVGNMALSYLVAKQFSDPVRRVLNRAGYPVPDLPAHRQWPMIMAVRISPLPWLMQSWLLTLGGARLLPYMLFGAPVQAIVGVGLVVVGDALFAGSLRWLLAGGLVVVLVQLVLLLARR